VLACTGIVGLKPVPPSDDGGVGGDGGSGEGSSADGGSVDGTSADADGAVSTDGAGTPCLSALPSGWTIVVTKTGNGPCPDGNNPAAAIGNPTAGPGTCTCNCMTTPPTCSGNVDNTYGNNVCNNNGGSIPSDGTCVQQSHTLSSYQQSTEPTASGGACSYTAQADAGAVTGSTFGVCMVPSSAQEATCEGMQPSGFSSCIIEAGGVSCPEPFTTKTLVYDPNPTISCSACGTCVPSTSCSGSYVFYSNAMCSSVITSVPADGACHGVGSAAGTTFNSVNFQVNPTTTCTGGATSSPTLTPSNQRTLCCRN